MADADGAVEARDPFQIFNEAAGAGRANPYPDFAPLRAQGDLVPLDLSGMGLMSPEHTPTVIQAVSYDAVNAVLRAGERFSSAGYGEVIGQALGRTILEMDEPEHHAYRFLIQGAFTRKAMDRWEQELVAPVVDELVDAFAGDGRAELVSQLFFPMPVRVIAAMLGLPDELRQEFHRLAVEIISITIDMALATTASRRLADLLQPLVTERRGGDGDDLISVLANAEHEGQHLTDEEVISFCRLLLPAGAETTYRSSSNLFCGLMTNPDQWAALRADRALLPAAIEEGLRWETPLLSIFRTALVDTEVCGVPVAAGTPIMVNIGSANHDERRWTDPERFDIHREPKAHVSFAAGPHMCLGMHLARMETQVMMQRILDRLPDLRPDPDAEEPYVTGVVFRAPPRLDVVF